jgi:hypothetical protein
VFALDESLIDLEGNDESQAMQLGLMTVACWGGTGYYEFAARAAARDGQ